MLSNGRNNWTRKHEKNGKVVANDPDLRQEHLRDMTKSDAMKASALHLEKHGVVGQLGDLDCVHVGWKNCPVAWQGAFQGKEGKPTMILEGFSDDAICFILKI